MIVAINYSDANYEKQRYFNTISAYFFGGVNKVIEYHPSDIDSVFYDKNKEILKECRGGGLWLWKPYFILKALDEISEDDYLFYCDSGAFYINKVQLIVDVLNANNLDLLVFDIPLLEYQFSSKACLDYFNINDYSKNQILGGYILLKKTSSNVSLIQEWLLACQNRSLIYSPDLSKEIQHDGYISHREDQTIFSFICHKHNIKSFRDPSQYGLRPWEYMADGRIYNELPHKESRYPCIVVNCRNSNPLYVVFKEYVKRLLYKFNIMSRKNED